MAEQYAITGSTATTVAESIEAGIRSGVLAPDSLLPPVRALASHLGLSPGTVAQAYRTLRQRGVVSTDGRRGTRVRARPAVRARSETRLPVPPGAIDVSTGSPDPRLLPAYGPVLARFAPEPVLYGRAGTTSRFAEAARRRLRADGVPDEAVTVTSGCLDGIERVLTAHLSPGDVVGVEDPGWSNLLDLLAALDLRPTPMAVDDDGPTPEGVREALAAGARAVVVTSRGQNPVGSTLTEVRARALRGVLAKWPHTVVVEDDHLGELAEHELHTMAGATRSWAFVRSMSKAYGPDLRCAVLAGDEETVARVEGRLALGARWVSTLLQEVSARLWDDPATRSTIDVARLRYRERRDRLLDELAARGVAAHGRSGLNVWVPVDDETGVCARLLDAGWVVAPGRMYRIASGPGIRLTTSALDEAAIVRLADAVAHALRPRAGVPSV
ncbi:MAG TPA: aminotransferase class I/II-fold pyridoxal phosphate-dependent enzyme [Actinopolymorphaceae bacterium]